MKIRTKESFNFVMNPPMADTMAFELKKNEAEYYKEAYKKEKEKNEQLEKLLDDSSKTIEVLNDAYQKTSKKYDAAVSKSAQILRSKQD